MTYFIISTPKTYFLKHFSLVLLNIFLIKIYFIYTVQVFFNIKLSHRRVHIKNYKFVDGTRVHKQQEIHHQQNISKHTRE